MLLCKNPECQKQIPNQLAVNGKKFYRGKRTYCLECSPFGEKRRIKDGEKRFCSVCEKEYFVHKNWKSKNICMPCRVNGDRFQKKLKAIDYLGGKCVDCGYLGSKCPDALAFHHKDPSKKSFNISGKHCLSWEKIKQELDKCELLCHNCHSERHYKEKINKQKDLITKFQQYKETRLTHEENTKILRSISDEELREDVTSKMIARKYGISTKSIIRLRWKKGIKTKRSDNQCKCPEKEVLENLLKTGNISKTAAILGVHRNTINKWVRKLKIDRNIIESVKIFEEYTQKPLEIIPQPAIIQ